MVSSRRVVIVVLAAMACLAVLAVLFAAAKGPAYDVRGSADVPYSAGTVKEVRVLDSATVYVDGESKPGPSVIAGIGLLVLATAAFMTAAVLRIARVLRRPGRSSLVTFYLLLCAGLAFAGLDELFAIHETIGHNLQFLADVPGVSRPDDLVFALYLIPTAAFAYLFRDVFLSDTRAAAALVLGFAFLVAAAAADLAGAPVEEYFEALCGLCIGTGLALLIHSHLSRALRIPADQLDELTVIDRRAKAVDPVGAGR
ncbi:MAG: hypothetical protein ABIM89_09060 [Mycobacteriales bacterium]